MQSHRSEVDMIWHAVNSFCTQIDNSVKNFARIIQQQHQNAQSPEPDMNTDLSGRSPVLSSVPASIPNQLSTLLFTNETKQVFLRTALTRELFQRLKRISKRWLANVPEEQRRQATKVAQAISKAVTDLRVSCISEKDLATYKAHIQQSFGREYNIPMEQIRLAFSQKIRVYLQNTKSEHSAWVEKYGGTVDINAPMVEISGGKTKEEVDDDDDDDMPKYDSISVPENMPKPEIDDTYNSFPPLRESPSDTVGLDGFHALPYKRSIDSLDNTSSPPDKRIKTQQPTNQFSDPSNFQPDNMFISVPGVPQLPSDPSIQNNNP